MTGVAWVDGALVPRAEARVSIDDFAVRYGAACFETMLARNGRVFRLGAHLDRIEGGLRAMRVAPPLCADLERAVVETLAANGLSEASVRLTVTAGHGHVPDLRAASAPLVIVTVDALPPRPASPRLLVVATRIDARRALAAAKSAQFLPYLLARVEAREAGFDDAVLLNHDGAVVEAATANLFIVRNDGIETPRIEDGPLPGVTRAALIEVARGLGVTVAERRIDLGDLALAEAVLLTSSVAGVVVAASLLVREDGPHGHLDWHTREPVPPLVGSMIEAYGTLVRVETDIV